MRAIGRLPRQTLERAGVRIAAISPDLVDKARSRQGFTLAELLVTMVMMIMASAVIAQALTFSYKVYFARTGDTEAQLLCQTVSLLVQDDLTKHLYTTSSSPSYLSSAASGTATLTDAYTVYDTDGTTLKSVENGATRSNLITINGTTLLPACYGYGSGTSAERTVSITVENLETSAPPTSGYYKATVSVKNRGGLTLATNTFTVYPLNIGP